MTNIDTQETDDSVYSHLNRIHWTKKKPRHMTLEIQVLDWDRHKNKSLLFTASKLDMSGAGIFVMSSNMCKNVSITYIYS
jgi:hypothetical protein